MSTYFTAWLAGFVDGEGHITIRRIDPEKRERGTLATFSPQIIISNNNERILTEIADTVQVGRVFNVTVRQPKETWNPRFQFQAVGRDAIDLARMLDPHLRVKHRQNTLLLAYPLPTAGRGRVSYEEYLEREDLWRKMQDLNKR